MLETDFHNIENRLGGDVQDMLKMISRVEFAG